MGRCRITSSGFLFAMLALWVQLVASAIVPRADPVTALFAGTTICHADEASDTPPPIPHRPIDCLICPLCVPPTTRNFTIVTSPSLPVPRVIVAMRAFFMPPATAPPVRVTLSARPRGPPIVLI
jgi:hypothetical protein